MARNVVTDGLSNRWDLFKLQEDPYFQTMLGESGVFYEVARLVGRSRASPSSTVDEDISTASASFRYFSTLVRGFRQRPVVRWISTRTSSVG
jgi:hypothetical protein